MTRPRVVVAAGLFLWGLFLVCAVDDDTAIAHAASLVKAGYLFMAAGVLSLFAWQLGLGSAVEGDDRVATARDPAEPQQIAGAACTFCNERIASELDGRECRDCGAAVHRDCVRGHRHDRHGKTSSYR